LPGFPIRRSTDRSLIGSSPWLIAAVHVLHRHLAPRHPPLALCSLGVRFFCSRICIDARARSAVLKGRAGPAPSESGSTGGARGHRRRACAAAGDKFERASRRGLPPQNGTVTSGAPGSGGASSPASRARGRKGSECQLTSDRRGSSPSWRRIPTRAVCSLERR
jgi:hypothetical protein